MYQRDVADFVDWAERGGVSSPESVDRVLLLPLHGVPHHAPLRPPHRRPQGVLAAPVLRLATAHRCHRIEPAVRLGAPTGESRLPHVLTRSELTTLLDEPPARIDDDPPAIRLRDDAVLELL